MLAQKFGIRFVLALVFAFSVLLFAAEGVVHGQQMDIFSYQFDGQDTTEIELEIGQEFECDFSLLFTVFEAWYGDLFIEGGEGYGYAVLYPMDASNGGSFYYNSGNNSYSLYSGMYPYEGSQFRLGGVFYEPGDYLMVCYGACYLSSVVEVPFENVIQFHVGGGFNYDVIADAGGPYYAWYNSSLWLDLTGSDFGDLIPLSCSWDIDNDGVYDVTYNAYDNDENILNMDYYISYDSLVNYYGLSAGEHTITGEVTGVSEVTGFSSSDIDTATIYIGRRCDVNHDGKINIKDFGGLAAEYLAEQGYYSQYDIAPFNAGESGDGVVDILDIQDFVSEWLSV